MMRRKKGETRGWKQRRPRWGKSRCQRQHAIRRGRERYGYMSDDIYDTLVSRIQANHKKANHIGDQSNRVSWSYVGYGFDNFRAGYDKKNLVIFTFLPVGSFPGRSSAPEKFLVRVEMRE